MGKLNQTKQSGTSQQQQTNKFEYLQAPENPYFQKAFAHIAGYDGGASGYREGAARNVNAINESGNEFFGASTPDYVRDKVRQSRLFSNNVDLGRGLAGAKQNELAFKNDAYMTLGAATAPDLVQTGSSGTASQSGMATPGMVDTIGRIGMLGA